MLSKIKTLWTDAEVVREFGMQEVALIERYKKVNNMLLIKRADRLFVAGQEEGSIVIYDCESDKPLIRMSGHFT